MSHSTIIIPCYNEAVRLNVPAIVRYAASHDHRLLLVNDGSTDATRDVLEDLVLAVPDQLQTLHLPENVGKAEAVRQGMLAAWQSGPRYVGYWDADLATPLEAIDSFVRHLDAHGEVDILLGSRVCLLGKRIERRWMRHVLGRVFATAAAVALRLPVYDTQCGAKLLRANDRTRALFAQPFLTRWLFDVELLARYLVLLGPHPTVLPIHELPLDQWRDVGGSKVRARDFLRAIGQLARIYRIYHHALPPASTLLAYQYADAAESDRWQDAAGSWDQAAACVSVTSPPSEPAATAVEDATAGVQECRS